MKYFLIPFFCFISGNFAVAQDGKPSRKLYSAENQIGNGDTLTIREIAVNRITTKAEIENAGFAASVIETKDAAFRSVQANELLDRSVGVRVRQSGGLGSQAVYNLNGMSGRSVGVFIDGIDISTYGSSFSLNSIPPALIERIEVYKGVLPAHLSGDFLGGAINIVLKKEGMRNQVSASLSYGSFNTQQADLHASYRDSKSGFFFKASGFYSYSDNDYEVWGKFVRNEMPDGRMVHVRARRFNDAFRSAGGRFEAGFSQVTWADQLMLSYNVSGTYDEVQHGQYMSKPYMGRNTRSGAHVFGVKYVKSDVLINGLDVNLNGVLSTRSQNILDTVPWVYNWFGEKLIGLKGVPVLSRDGAQQGRPTLNHINRSTASARGGFTYRFLDGHTFVVDHNYYTVDRSDHDEIRTVLEQKFRANSDLIKNVSALSYQLKAFDARLQTNFFAKYYVQDIHRTEPVVESINNQNTVAQKEYDDRRSAFGYGLAVAYRITSNLNLISSAEKAVRMPSEGEIFGEQADNLVASLNIRPEISENLNLGFRWKVFQTEYQQLSVYTSAFWRDTKDKIAILSNDRSVSNVETLYQVNLDRTQSIGFESELLYVFRKFQALATVSRFNALYKNPSVPQRHNVQIPNEPYFMGNGSFQYLFEKLFARDHAVNVYYQWAYVSPFNTIWDKTPDQSNMTPAQFIQDVGASYIFPNRKVILSLDAKNIFNREVYDNFAAQKPGRAFYIKLNYTIK